MRANETKAAAAAAEIDRERARGALLEPGELASWLARKSAGGPRGQKFAAAICAKHKSPS